MSDGTTAVETSAQVGGAEATPAPGGSWDDAANEIMGLPEGSRLAGDAGSIVAQPRPVPEQPEGEAERGAQETESAKPAEEQAQPKPEVKPGEEQPERVELDKAAEAAIPATWKEWMKADPKLRDAIYSERAYREVFPTVRAAREVAEMFPGGAEDARGLVDAADRMTNTDRILGSGTDEERAGLLDYALQLAGPERYSEFVMDGLALLAKTNPQTFDGYIREIAELRGITPRTNGAREPSEFDELLGAEPGRVKNDEAERLRAELDQLREQHAARERAAVEQAESAVSAQARDGFVSAAVDMTEKAMPNSPEGARNHIAGLLLRNIVARLENAPGYHARVQQARMSGGPQAAAQVFLAQAKAMAPSVLKEILQWWTTEALAANKATVQNKQAIAARGKDVGAGGVSMSGPAVPRQSGRPNYAAKSDMELLNE
jgi:hypothetical protein